MRSELITSPQNNRVKQLRRLEKNSERKEQGLFVVEGVRELSLALSAGYKVDTVFACADFYDEQKDYPVVQQLHRDVPFLFLSEELYGTLAYRSGTEGIMAIMHQQQHSISNLKFVADGLYLLIEAVEKPGNLGAMLRTADAAGVDGVLVCDAATDFYNPNVIRSSLGTAFTNAVAVCSNEEALLFFKTHRIKSYAASLQTEELYYGQNFTTPTAMLLGSEADGLSTFWNQHADCKVKIPMHGKIDSLNVAATTAILLFEAQRQRSESR